MTAAAALLTGRKDLPLRLLQAVVVYWLILRSLALFAGEPHADEAYYWLWGQHLAWSYFDHPGLHAWLQALMSAVFGWSNFALRALTIFTTAITVWLVYLWSRRLAPERWQYTFWLSLAVYFASPLMMLYTAIALNDRVLIACGMLAVHFFAWFFAEWAEGKGRYRWLYLGAIFLGLAALTKYSGVFVGLGVLAAILVRRDLRPLLRNPHLYLAAILSVAMQAPTVFWTLQTGLTSVEFQLAGRGQAVELSRIGIEYPVTFLLESLVVVGPFLVWPLIRFLALRRQPGFAGTLLTIGKWVFLASSLAMLALSFTQYILFYWNIVAYTVFAAVAAWFMRSRILIGLHILYGVIFNTLLIVQFTVAPILPHPNSRGHFGWADIGVAVVAAKETSGAEFLAAPSWGTASKLALAVADPDVAAITARTDAFDFWFDETAVAGEDAVILIEPDDRQYLPYLAMRFETLEPAGGLDIARFGQTFYRYEIYVGRGFRPAGPP